MKFIKWVLRALLVCALWAVAAIVATVIGWYVQLFIVEVLCK